MTWDEFNAAMHKRSGPVLAHLFRALAEQMPQAQREAFFARVLELQEASLRAAGHTAAKPVDTGTERG